MISIDEIQVGFTYTQVYGRDTIETLTVIETPGKLKGFRVTSDRRSNVMTTSRYQVAKATGLAR